MHSLCTGSVASVFVLCGNLFRTEPFEVGIMVDTAVEDFKQKNPEIIPKWKRPRREDSSAAL